MDLSGLIPGEPTKLIGFPTPFGTAPPDFDARTVVDFPKLPATLDIAWGVQGTTAPFSSEEATGLVLDLQNTQIGAIHLIGIGPRLVNLLTLPHSPTIAPAASGASTYLIVTKVDSQSFTDFADFVTELGTRLDGTTAMVSLTATGSYNGDTNAFTARSIVVILK
jgi:hypothetical protein